MRELSRQHYVYLHRRASDGGIFYVGKGKDRRAWSAHSRNRHWQHIAAKHGFEAAIVKAGLPECCALSLERVLVAALGRERLANITDGGGGTSGWKHTEEAKRRIGLHSKSRPVTPAMLAALDSRGRKPTPEAIEKMRAAKIGKKRGPMPLERRAKIAASHIGIRPTEEARRKMSASKVGRFVGQRSPSYDHTIRSFLHTDGQEFSGTRYDFVRAFGLGEGCVSDLINGKRKSVKGWKTA